MADPVGEKSGILLYFFISPDAFAAGWRGTKVYPVFYGNNVTFIFS